MPIRIWKQSEEKERPLLITLIEENKSCEISRNPYKIREAGTQFNTVIGILFNIESKG